MHANQLLGVIQRLGDIPKREKLNFSSYFYVSLTWASGTHDEKSMILIILEHFLHKIHNMGESYLATEFKGINTANLHI